MAIARKPTGLRLLVEKVIDKGARSKKDGEALKRNALQNRVQQQIDPDDADSLNRMSEMIAATRNKSNKKTTKKSSA